MSWAARFLDGPAYGSVDRVFVVGPPWRKVSLAGFGTGFMPVVVGGDQMPGDAADPRWPDQADYELSYIEDGDPDAIAYYRWVPFSD